ncbi:hypothetical protein TraAM80_04975 [Trypanosoma rangeli]|uniref:Uncharacterized protein n=1 Tax=Trypanosoma rangeli TaxID=5698 RepID=A0A3S5IR71_TRYRA|nr:uncharacterized protein TraAM80_04975 [Trypanosoma rangeli]RNF04843.1 hypothetical protein TraAM80_04975 [Trypanosoma rangeli]|eukprot:RNF04843.1 hypothetical protein TraAM80_04975 [Trypanosoma rangeli]
MSLVQLSPTGRVACGGSFLDMYGRRPPATIQAVHPTGAAQPPPLMSWSAFPTSKKMSGRNAADADASANPAGEHVALVFPHVADTSSHALFFSVGVFRCDTWALQWAVRADALGDGRRVCDVCCLSAHTVAFIVEGGSTQRGRRELYVASKADVPRVAKRENRQWRSFLAGAHLVGTTFEGEGFCSLQALSATSCLLLTGAGRLIRVTVAFDPQVEVTSEEVFVDERLTAARNSSISSLVLSSAITTETGGANCHAAVFAAGSSTCYVMKLMDKNAAMTASRPQPISLPAGATVERAEFAGPHILSLTLSFNKRTTFALQIACLVPSQSSTASSSSSPSESPFNCIPFEPLRMAAQQVPLATMYCAEKETHVVLVRRPHRGTDAGGHHDTATNSIVSSSESSWWSCLEYAELPLQEGPYPEEVFRNATWRSLPEPCSTALPTVAPAGALGSDDNDGDNEDDINNNDGSHENTAADFQRGLALLTHSSSGGQWEPIRLHYALAASLSQQKATRENNSGGSSNVVVNVLAIETAPFVHTRLVKQWHNATRGLKYLLDGANNTVGGLAPFAVTWNPRHLRRALRLFSQEGLRLLFSHVAGALRVSTQPSEVAHLFYGTAVTAVTDVALHIITLARQVGALLSPEDVAVTALLLRASRATGHLIVNHTARGRLLLESVVRSRLANHVLGAEATNHRTAYSSGDPTANEEVNAAEAEFLNAPAELRVERALRTKYAPNTWTQHLLWRHNEHSAVVREALRHLQAVAPLRQQDASRSDGEGEGAHLLQSEEVTAAPPLVPDWMLRGQQAHANAAFTEYESALVHPAAAAAR